MQKTSVIMCLYVSTKGQYPTKRKQLRTCLKKAKTIPGTKASISMVYSQTMKLVQKALSKRQDFDLIFDLESAQKHTKNIQPGDFVVFKFDRYH